MTDENLAAGTLSAGIDLPATDAAQHVSDITAMFREIEAHIDLHDVGETASTWLAIAREYLKASLESVDRHFAEFEAKAKAEVAEIEASFTLETGEAVEKAGTFVAGVAAATDIR